MKKKIIFVIVLMIIFNNRVEALTYGGCDYSNISRLKSLVSNVNISYNYRMVSNTPYFDVTLNNITPDMYFYDTLTRKTYTYQDTNNGEITIYDYSGISGSYKFYSTLKECSDISLGTKYYKFPSYNTYYNSDLCKDIPNYSLCQKWVNVNYSNSEFESLVNDYKNSLNKTEDKEEIIYESSFLNVLINIYVNYYYYFLGAIILICGTIIIIKSRNNKFDL